MALNDIAIQIHFHQIQMPFPDKVTTVLIISHDRVLYLCFWVVGGNWKKSFNVTYFKNTSQELAYLNQNENSCQVNSFMLACYAKKTSYRGI